MVSVAHVLIIHEVADYLAWKRVFDDAAGARKVAGEVSFQLLRRDDQENVIVHLSRWTSLEAARAFFESEALVELRRRSGVPAPEFHYLERFDEGVL